MNDKTNIIKLVVISIICTLLFTSCNHHHNYEAIGRLSTVFETSRGTQSADYETGINWWKSLDNLTKMVTVTQVGVNDDGSPMHAVWIDRKGDTTAPELGKRRKNVILINNAIHPGEPDGVDACMLLAKELLQVEKPELLYHNTLVIIPYYNTGGARKRGRPSRANQNGPESYGFRGNAQNLDLNRDFIKADAANSLNFIKLFRSIDPDLYIETHVSNGADYQYNITCLPTLPQKLDSPLNNYFKTSWIDGMYNQMKQQGEEMCPYVNVFNNPPDSGFDAFIDYPRYSTGYAALYQTPGFITETHMLKPYDKRVKATFTFFKAILAMTVKNADLRQKRMEARQTAACRQSFSSDWQINRNRADTLAFKGFVSFTEESPVTGSKMLYYNQNNPILAKIPYYSYAEPICEIHVPKLVFIEPGFTKVKQLLDANMVKYRVLSKDTIFKCNRLFIDSFTTANWPYEGHYQHSKTFYHLNMDNCMLLRGTLVVDLNQTARRYLTEVLTPNTPDSWFNWNFFDTRLQQKEWYSSYVFEPKARQILEKDSSLKKIFEARMATDTAFAANSHERLYFIYRHSDFYEPEHMTMPYLMAF